MKIIDGFIQRALNGDAWEREWFASCAYRHAQWENAYQLAEAIKQAFNLTTYF